MVIYDFHEAVCSRKLTGNELSKVQAACKVYIIFILMLIHKKGRSLTLIVINTK